jgi:hypothetical protein
VLDWSLARDPPDGGVAALTADGEGGGDSYTVFVRRTDGSPAVRLGAGAGFALSPDGRWALIRKAGESQGLELVPTGTGSPRNLPLPGLDVHGARFFPDGHSILVAGNEKGRPIRAYVAPIAGGTFRSLAPESIDTRGAAISPDGGTVALLNPEGKLLLCPSDGGAPRPVPGLEHVFSPMGWSADGRSIYVRQRGEVPLRIRRLDPRTGRLELVKEITTPDGSGVGRPGTASITPDAASYVYSYTQTTSDLYLVQGVK